MPLRLQLAGMALAFKANRLAHAEASFTSTSQIMVFPLTMRKEWDQLNCIFHLSVQHTWPRTYMTEPTLIMKDKAEKIVFCLQILSFLQYDAKSDSSAINL